LLEKYIVLSSADMEGESSPSSVLTGVGIIVGVDHAAAKLDLFVIHTSKSPPLVE